MRLRNHKTNLKHLAFLQLETSRRPDLTPKLRQLEARLTKCSIAPGKKKLKTDWGISMYLYRSHIDLWLNPFLHSRELFLSVFE